MALRCDVVAVGTELLLGQITDTNSAYIGEQLALSGIDSLRQVKVGDNLARIVDELRLALGRADAVIVCGGLGPTHDDITREAIAEVMGAELVLDDEVADRIREMFAVAGAADAGEQPAPGHGPRRRDGDPPDPRHGAGPDLPGRRQGRLRHPGRAPRAVRDARAGGAARPPAALGRGRGDRQPRAAHVGRERERAQRAPRPAHRAPRPVRQHRRSPSWPAAGRGSRSG